MRYCKITTVRGGHYRNLGRAASELKIVVGYGVVVAGAIKSQTDAAKIPAAYRDVADVLEINYWPLSCKMPPSAAKPGASTPLRRPVCRVVPALIPTG